MPLSPLAPSLEGLEVFISSVELGSLSKAAARHHISQPAVSAKIQDLERLLKLTLLQRSPNGSTVTDSGMEIYSQATEIIAAVQRLMSTADELARRRSGRLKIYSSFAIAEYLLPYWLSVLKDGDATLAPELTVGNSWTVIQRVREIGGLGFAESEFEDDALEKVCVGRDELLVVVGNRHPWSRRRHPVDTDELATWTFVTRERGSGVRSVFETEMAERGYPALQVAAQLGSNGAVKHSLATGTNAAVLSRLVVERELLDRSLVRVEVIDLGLRRSLYALWSRQKGISHIERKLVSVALQASDKGHLVV